MLWYEPVPSILVLGAQYYLLAHRPNRDDYVRLRNYRECERRTI